MTNLTTENAGDLLQPVFDAASTAMSEKLKGILDVFKTDSETRFGKLEKAMETGTNQEIDLNDPVAVQAHLDSLLNKEEKVDMKDPGAVRAYLATLEKSKDDDDESSSDDPKDVEIEKLKRDLVKARGGTNLRTPRSSVLVDDLGEINDDDFIKDINDDLEK